MNTTKGEGSQLYELTSFDVCDYGHCLHGDADRSWGLHERL